MIVEIKVPELGESINEVEIGEWLVKTGTRVERDDEVVALESDKATVEVPAPQGGVLVEIVKEQGETAAVGEVIGKIDTDRQEDDEESAKPDQDETKDDEQPKDEKTDETAEDTGEAQEKKENKEKKKAEKEKEEEEPPSEQTPRIMPAAARVLAEHDIDPESVTPSGPGDRILKEDALRAVEDQESASSKEEEPTPQAKPKAEEKEEAAGVPGEHRVPMTPIRRTIAARLLEAKQNMALLTTFNEVDMYEVKRARSELGEGFAQKHDVRLGFMSFFVKAAVSALVDFPLVNAGIDGSDIVYHDSCNIGVAIGGGKGLVVPVLKQAERLSFAEIEKKIEDFAEKAKNNTLEMKELEGGTFTISNGGVYGSMLSTPIVNPPQSAILGLHAIKDRPVAMNDEVVIRPIMYLALSYDHRLIDGREAVTFLKTIKERIEQPQKLLLEI